jgi:hypothetical protein
MIAASFLAVATAATWLPRRDITRMKNERKGPGTRDAALRGLDEKGSRMVGTPFCNPAMACRTAAGLPYTWIQAQVAHQPLGGWNRV